MDGKCGACRKVVKEKEQGIQCNSCQFWFHAPKCAEVKDTLLDFLASDDGQSANISWYCKICGVTSKKLFEQMVAIDVRLTTVEDKLRDISSKIDELVLNSRSSTPSPPPAVSGGMAPQALSAVTNELREREKRAANAVFVGNVSETQIKTIADKAGIEQPLKIVKVGKPENFFYIATFKSENEKWHLVAKARAICMSNEGLKGIFVNPDLTKAERDHQYLLRKELRERKLNGEDVIIKKGAVVVRNK